MTRAAELVIQALNSRKPAPMLERQTGLPYGWGLWLRSRRSEHGTLSREKSEGIVSELVQRPTPPPEAIAPELGFWRALRSLFYQQWEPPLREERPLRWFASATSLLMHLLFLLLLVWVAVVRLPPPPPQAGDGSRVQVEFVGRGTPQEEGGGAPAQASASAQSAAASAASTSAPAVNAGADIEVTHTPRTLPEFVPPAPTVSAAVPQVREREIAEPTPQAAQPVQVTEAAEPQAEYVLPPPTLRRDAVSAPTVTAREIAVQEREVTVVQAPEVTRVLRDTPMTMPRIERPVPQVREREIAAPLPQVRTIEVPSRIAPTRELPSPSVAVREREIPTPRPAPVAGTGTQPSPSNTATGSAATTGTAAAPTPGPVSARPSNATASGTAGTTAARGTQPGARATGPAAADRSGGWATPTRGDDRGASNRNVAGDSGANAGQSPGLFNADGSVRLPGSSGAGDNTASRGAPGGENDQWTREKIDKSGTWLQRPPYDYEPTSLDKYWVPNESLLAEWVRKNIRETTIAIPGTNKKIRCVISVLQVGGGCGLFDPNLNEQPATARPPPDIPVKRTPIPTDS